MNGEPRKSTLPACFARYPGIVLEIRDGVVTASNGRIERDLELDAIGHPFACSSAGSSTMGSVGIRELLG